jgi:hypothetical protein
LYGGRSSAVGLKSYWITPGIGPAALSRKSIKARPAVRAHLGRPWIENPLYGLRTGSLGKTQPGIPRNLPLSALAGPSSNEAQLVENIFALAA